MAYDEVTEDNVYLCVGHPPRRDIENIVKWMLNDHFSVAYNSILYDLESELLISFLYFIYKDTYVNLSGSLSWLI